MDAISEIYRDAVNKTAILTITGATVSAVKFVRDGADVIAVWTSGASVPIPYSITREDGYFDVVWTYTVGGLGPYTRRDRNNVVTPYFTKADLVADDATASILSDATVIKREAVVRSVITSITGQTFGYKTAAVEAFGSGDSVLLLPTHIEEITSVAYADVPLSPFEYDYRPVNSGYGIEMIVSDYGDSIKVPAYEEQIYAGIINPEYLRRGVFRDNVEYVVQGTFGYVSVPNDIQLAAIMMAEGMSSVDSAWVDRYVKKISAADWSLEFNGGALEGTGNATVDRILNGYSTTGIAVI